MPSKLPLTLACGDYEILRALKEGTLAPDGIDLTLLTAMDSTTRHWRFLRNQEFDMAEVSASSYLVARDRGAPIVALPVFPHRRFRHGFIFINTGKGIKEPGDLVGRRIGVKHFMVTAILWLRGILEHEYAVPHKSIDWFSEIDEDLDFTPPPDLKFHRLADERSVETMLAEGELDAVLHSDLIKPLIAGDRRVARLFPDHKREEMAYFKKTGIFPIMHVVAMKRAIVERHPWVAINMYLAFTAAKAMAMRRMENPRLVPLAWYREAWEEQQAILGPDPWEYGLTAQNRKTLATLAGYSHEQGLISRAIPPEELFLEVSQGRKRGDEFRI